MSIMLVMQRRLHRYPKARSFLECSITTANMGGKGAYQNIIVGDSPENNNWIQYEIPTLQHKSQATKVTTFAINDNSYHFDWERGVKGKIKPYNNPMELIIPPVKRSDESNACTSDNNPKDYEDEGECEE